MLFDFFCNSGSPIWFASDAVMSTESEEQPCPSNETANTNVSEQMQIKHKHCLFTLAFIYETNVGQKTAYVYAHAKGRYLFI